MLNANLNYTLTGLLLLLCISLSHGQTTYKGIVADSKKEPVAFANVIAFKRSDEKIIKGVITDDNGVFELNVSEIPFYIEVSFIGFQNKKIIPTKTDLGTIILEEQTTELKEVLITVRKKLIEQKVDRLVFDAENSVVSSGGSALDVLKVTPGVQVNGKSINIVGKSSVRVLVNDRILQLSGEELLSYLDNFASDDIKNIEVITTPPARYEAEGDGGLINIVLKKSKEDSWSNQIRTSYIQTTYPAIKFGNTFNYNHKKWRFLGTLGLKKGHEQHLIVSKIYFPTNLWNDTLVMKDKKDYLSVKFGLDYRLSLKSSVGVLYSGNYNTPDSKDHSNNYIFDNKSQVLGSIKTNGFTDKKTNLNSLNVHYIQKLDTLGKSMSMDLDYFNYIDNQNREFTSKGTGRQNIFQKSNNTGNQNITNYSVKIDFTHPTKFANFSYGGKITQTKTDNNVKFFEITNGKSVLDRQKSNVFEYKENIQALYVDVAKDFNEKWQGKIGVRMENTQTKGYFEKLNKTVPQEYIKLFPTLYLNYIKDEKNVFNLAYNGRINRPIFYKLNPFRFYTNRNSYVVGNPSLQPTFSDGIEFKYINRNKYITELFFQHQKGMTGQILNTNNNIQVYSFENVGNIKAYGIKQTVLYNPFKWWNTTNLFTSFNADMELYQNLNFTSKIFSGWNFQFYTNQVFLLNQEGTLQAEIIFSASGKGNQILHEVKPYYGLDLGIKMQFLDRKLQVTTKLKDVFNSSSPNVTMYTNNIRQEIYNNWDNRYFTLGLSYKFGNNKINLRERIKGNVGDVNRVN